MSKIQNRVNIWSFFLLFVLTIGGSSSLLAQKIERVEPANWWVGMNCNEIELLIYGDGIGELSASIAYPRVILKQVKQVANKNYLFVTLEILPNAKPGTIDIVFKKNNKTVLSQPFPLLEREAGRADIKGFDASDVIYVITPDRFANGDTSNDNVAAMKEVANRSNKGGRHGGDIKGIDQNLDYIANMGFTSVWINPMLENNMPEYSYHGYSITDYYKTDPRFGSNDTFKQMVENANAKGLKIIMDMVVNHIGLEHWWMKDMPMEDWINQWETFTPTNHKKTVVLDPYASKIDKKTFVDGWFVETMPDLNQRNLSMAQYLIQNTIWWVEYAGISGIRMDTYSYSDMNFLTLWTKAVMDEYPNFNIVGEEWIGLHASIAYWQKGKVNSNAYVSNLKSVMDFPLQEALVKSLNGTSSWQSSWADVYQSLSQDYHYADPQNIITFADNHDMSRIFTQLNEDYGSWKLAMTLLLTTRGIPSIYYGTEILMTNADSDDHGIIRSDFPGGWAGDAINAFKGEGLQAQQKEASQFLQNLLQWRKNNLVVQNGKLMHFASDINDVYVYFRYLDNQKVMILLNKNAEPISLQLDKYREILGESSMGKDVISNQEIDFKTKIEIPARTPMVIEITK